MKTHAQIEELTTPSRITRSIALILLGLVLLPGPMWAAEKPVRVLILTGQNNHDWAATTEQIKTILLSDGRFVVDVTEQPENLDKSAGEKYDVLLSNWNAWGKSGVKDWPAATREAFLSFVREGRGLVVVHAGSSSFLDWDDYQNLVGGTWGKETGHGAVHTFTVQMTDQEHPITRGLEPFQITDELWHRTALRSPRVLATAFSAADKGGSGRDEPVAFVTEFGKGRGFNLVLGHDVRAMQAEGFQILLRRGTEWAATGKVASPQGGTTGPPRPNRPDSEWTVASPSGAIRATLKLDQGSGTLSYQVTSRGRTVIEPSPLGITTSVADFTRGLACAAQKFLEINESYTLPVGKRSTYLNRANELVLSLRRNQDALRVRFRAYDEGIAFSYALDGSGSVSIFSETSGFRLADGGPVTYWGQNHPNNYGYETMLGRIEGERMSMPVLAELKHLNHFLFVAQAASYGTYIVPHFERTGRQLNVRFPLDQEGPVETTLPFQSPWRLAIISPETLAALVESTMLENLNPSTEPELRDADWIKPGRTSWDFLAGDRERPQLWIDFDAAMGWEYHLVDAGFARRFDVTAATRYAREKNVRMIGWGYTPDLNTREKAETILTQYAEMGLSGAKLDFFDHHPFTGNKRTQDFEDTQASLRMRDYLMEIAAQKRLVLEFHGCTLPSGERRRYPHFMTAEGVAGMEKRNPKTENELTIPYVRNIMGPVSFTVIKFDRSLGSHAYQIAQTVVYEAGLQIYAERHDRLREFAGVEFLKEVPAAWDETRFLEGYPGSHAVFARRKGRHWFIGGMTVEPRTVQLPLSFLAQSAKYQARIYRDGPAKTNLVIQSLSLTRDSKLELPMLQNGGLAVSLQPADETKHPEAPAEKSGAS